HRLSGGHAILSFYLNEEVEAAFLGQMSKVANEVCDGVLVACATVFWKTATASAAQATWSASCRHFTSSRLENFFHEHRTIGEFSIPAKGGDSSGRCIHVVKLLRTFALVSCHGPAPQELISRAIIVGYVQLPICVDYNVNFDPLFVCPNAVTTRIADTPA